jgi:hypothetical protein
MDNSLWLKRLKRERIEYRNGLKNVKPKRTMGDAPRAAKSPAALKLSGFTVSISLFGQTLLRLGAGVGSLRLRLRSLVRAALHLRRVSRLRFRRLLVCAAVWRGRII